MQTPPLLRGEVDPTDPHLAEPSNPGAPRRTRIDSPIASTDGPLTSFAGMRD
jgi:hypothetical protein